MPPTVTLRTLKAARLPVSYHILHANDGISPFELSVKFHLIAKFGLSAKAKISLMGKKTLLSKDFF